MLKYITPTIKITRDFDACTTEREKKRERERE